MYERRARERKRIRSWPRGTSGSHNNKIKKFKKGTHSHTATHPYKVTLDTSTHSFFFVCVVFVLLGVFRCGTHDPFLSFFFFFSFSPVDLSSFYLLHSFHLSRQYKRGMSRPVPSRNPSLHLCVRACVSFFFFSRIFSTLQPLSHISLNLAFCIFIAFVLADILPLSFLFFSSRSSVFWGGWQASFQVSGNCYCFPSQLESGSHSTAHKHTHTKICTLFFFFSFSALSPSLSLFVWVVYTDMWLCGLVYTVAWLVKDAPLVGVPGSFSSAFCLFIIPLFIRFSPSSNKS